MLRSGRRSRRNFAARGFASVMVAGGLVSGLHAEVMVIELAKLGTVHPGFRIQPFNDIHQLSTSASGAGDVNGDGLADVILGAPWSSPGGNTWAGESFVVFGKSGGASVDLATLATGGIRMDMINTSRYCGGSVSGAGDVNGDGLGDLIVSAKVADPTGYANTGAAYVVFGRTDPSPVDLSAPGTGGFRIERLDPPYLKSFAVSGAGDVNGDGLADLILGARYAGTANAGESYVVFGKSDSSPVDLAMVSAGSGGFRVEGINPNDRSGLSVSGAGDVNGDGLSDLIIGTMYASPVGKIVGGQSYVVFGKADGAPVKLADMGTNGFRIDGAKERDGSGWSVAGAGDVNGDGLADLIVGAPWADPMGRTSAGASYVVFGKADDAPVDLAVVVLGTGGFRIGGGVRYDHMGVSVSGAGDVNGDGLADLIVGADDADHGSFSDVGESYVVFGKAGGTAVDVQALGTGGFRIDGVDGGDHSGSTVSGAGDVNGDGLADVLVGAYRAVPAESSGDGEGYVIFSPAAAPPSAIYKATAPAGDAPRVAIGMCGDGSNDSTPDSRCWIDFSEGSGPGLDGSSIQTVTLTRNNRGIAGLERTSSVLWRLETNRSDPAATVTFRYLDREVHPFHQSDLRLYRADDPAGPWEPVTDGFFVDTARNQIGGNVSALGYFAIQLNPVVAQVDFAATSEGWIFAVPTPPFSATMKGIHSVASGALISMTHDNVNSFGFWESPLMPLSPEATGEELLYKAIFTLSSDVADRSLAPTMRLRLSTGDFQRSDILTVTSIGAGDLSPDTAPRDYTAMYYGSADQLRLDFDMLNVDRSDRAKASIGLQGVRLDLVDTDRLEQAGNAVVLEPSKSPGSWTAGFDATGAMAAPAEFLTSELGLLVRGEYQDFTQESPVYTHPVIFGFWSAAIPAPGNTEAIYHLRWTVGSDATSRAAVPTFRMRVNDASMQFASLVVIDSPDEAAPVPVVDQYGFYDQWFLLPAPVAGNDWLVSFDYLYADTSRNDDPTTGLWLRRVKITRYKQAR